MTPALAALGMTLLPPMLRVEGRLFRLADRGDALFWISSIGEFPVGGVTAYIEATTREPRAYVVVDLNRTEVLDTPSVLVLLEQAVLTLRDLLTRPDLVEPGAV